MYVYLSISTHIIIQSNNFYVCIITCIFVSIPKYKYSYNCNYLYFIDCEFEILFENNYTANIEINYHYNTDYINIKNYLLFYIDSCEVNGYKFKNINQMIIKTISCICNMSYKYYVNQPMSMLERRINFNIARNPRLINSLDRNKNHPLIRKYSHI